jgi:hypothetical protein
LIVAYLEEGSTALDSRTAITIVENYVKSLSPNQPTPSPKQAVKALGESNLRQYLSSPTKEDTANFAARALALGGTEPETGDVLIAYIKDPRGLPNTEQLDNEHARFVKINMVPGLSRFNSPSVVNFLLNLVDAAKIRKEMPMWVDMVGRQEGDYELSIAFACLRGRASVALMLMEEPVYNRIVVDEYNKTVGLVESAYNIGNKSEAEQEYLMLLLKEMKSGVAIGDCVEKEGPAKCLEYLESLEGIAHGLGPYFSARPGYDYVENIGAQ